MEHERFRCGWCRDEMERKFRKSHARICRAVQRQAEQMVQEIEEWLALTS